MVAEVIGVGTALLAGDTMRQDVAFLAGELAALGVELHYQSTVGDNKARLQACIAKALERSDMIILLGGIGSSTEDITKETVARGLGSTLVCNQPALAHLQEYYREQGRELPAFYEKEAMVPQGAVVFPNSRGTAVGCALSAGSQCILMLPETPRELMPMLVNHAYSYLADRAELEIAMQTLRFQGITAAHTQDLLEDLLQCENPIVALYPVKNGMLARVTGRAQTAQQAQKITDAMLRDLNGRMKQYVVAPQAKPAQTPPAPTEKPLAAGAKAPKNAPRQKLKWYQKIFPQKGDDGREIARKLVLLVAVLTLCGSTAYIADYYYSAGANKQLVAGMESMFSDAEKGDINRPAGYPKDYLTKFVPWWELNPDVAGRVEVVGTPLKYAIVQAKDNDFYLRRNFNKKDDKHGVPFVDFRVNLKKESTNTVIYGHNMKDGQIFGELMNYKGLEYYRKNPVIKFDSVYREADYKIISVFVTNIYARDGAVWDYQNFIEGDTKALNEFVEKARVRSLINTTVDVKPGDKLLTLSTCTYEFRDARFVVVARKVREGESSSVDVANAKMNPNPVMPQGYYTALSQAAMSSSSSQQTSLETASSESSSEESSESSMSSMSESSLSESSMSSESSGAASSMPPSSSSLASSSRPSSSSAASSKPSKPSSSTAPSKPSSSAPESSKESKPSSSSEEDTGGESSTGVSAERDRNAPITSTEQVTVDGEQMQAFDAVCGMVQNETGGTFKAEALKAQAVAIYSRLVARGGNVTAMYVKTPNSSVQKAVRAVWGETVQSGGSSIDCYFYSTSAGNTNTAREVWGGSLPGHNENVAVPWDESSRYHGLRTSFSRSTVISKVKSKLGVDLTDIPEAEWFVVESTTGGGYNAKMTVGGKSTTGRVLRESVLGLKSAAFEWEFSGDEVIFITYGYGHGCGMSQNAANAMAGEGSTYTDILEYFYTGCTVG